jgi:MoxR-like ATPase
MARKRERADVAAVINAQTLARMQAGVETVTVDADVVRYCVDLAGATRAHPAIAVGASPRGSQALLLMARSLAVIAGRGFILPEDVKRVAVAVLAHRLSLTTQAWAAGTDAAQVVAEIVGSVPGPLVAGTARA